jgi:hypothetical protein
MVTDNIIRQSRLADREKIVAGMAHDFLGKEVDIEWYDPHSRQKGGMEGKLIEITTFHPIHGIELVVDWGYSVEAAYVTRIREIAPKS